MPQISLQQWPYQDFKCNSFLQESGFSPDFQHLNRPFWQRVRRWKKINVPKAMHQPPAPASLL